MSRALCSEKIMDAIENMSFKGQYLNHTSYGNGHINDTYLVNFQKDEVVIPYILQRINHQIFKNPEALMHNIVAVTSFLKEKITLRGGDVNRETLNVIPTKEGAFYYKDGLGNYWRSYAFLTDTICYEILDNPELFYQSAYAFGNFQKLLSDYPADTLSETIPDFHNTPVRFQTFVEAVKADVCGRAHLVQEEINFVMEREAFTHILTDKLLKGDLPLRVTHNDTKLNNSMFDTATNKPICIIDLDTVMPGLSVNDFGDSIRFGATTGAEDEPDLTKVNFDLNLFESYTKGFLEGCGGNLTEEEINMLPIGAMTMTLECGMRFLTDYLQGDTYFHVHRDGHNLDRCRTQFKLVSDMEKHFDTMNQIINKYR
ncbi:MAG: aminoglycoside phosphotransferase family protein [Niameybacter sp.]|uniref:phosphotransferase enzyme family protein n=1 Tax=Niameybacter sp. TaxID=2033640 RepID=UPI002FCC119B